MDFHGNRNAPHGLGRLGCRADGTDLEILELFQCSNGLWGVQQAGAVGMQIQDFDLIQFFGLEFGIKIIDDKAVGLAVLKPQRQMIGFDNGKNTFAVSKDGITNVGNAFQNAVIYLRTF
jgi:hypothetical protein